MQSKIVIAALIGAVSAKDLEKMKHALVQSIQTDISSTIHDLKYAIDHGAEDVEDAIEEVSETAQSLIDDVEVSLGVKPLRSADDIKKIEGIVGGILKGAIKAEGFDDINSCIKDAEIIFQDAEEAFTDFKTGDVNKIADGVGKLADLLEHVMAGMKDCSHVKADWSSIVKMITVFKSPESFVWHIGKDLLINGKDIFSEIMSAIDFYEKKNWEQFGEQVGMAAAKTLLGEEPEHKLTKVESDAKLESIVAGILQGALHAEGFDDINECIKDNEVVFQDAEEAYLDFTSKDYKKITEGVQKVADLLTHVKSGMSDCSHLKADWEKLDKMADIFASPKAFAYHVGKDLLINGKDIFSEVGDAISAYKKKDWQKFGVDIGTAAAKTILGEEAPVATLGSDDKMKLAQIEQGVLKAYGGQFDVLALLECIGDEDKSLLMFDVAIQQFQNARKEKSPQEAIGGIIALVAAVQQFKAGLPTCEAIDTFDITKFDASYDIAVNPVKHLELMERNILIDGVPVKKHIKKAMKAYKNEDYVTFGYQVGTVLQFASSEQAAPVETSVQVEESLDNIKDRKMVAEVAQGFLESTKVGSFNFTNLLVCIYEADQSALALYSAIDVLEKAYKDKDPQEAIGGIVGIIAFVQALKQSIPTCEAIDQRSMDWSHFNNIVDVVESPEKHMSYIENDIIFNEVAITFELSQALDAFRSMDYNEFGYKVGQAMFLATEAPAGLHLY